MIFSENSIKQILANKKTQTRRLLKEGESLVTMRKNRRVLQVVSKKGAVKWEVGKTKSIQAGRGIKGIEARIRINHLRSQNLYNISPHEVKAEGFETRIDFLKAFWKLNKLPELSKCLVWVVEFEKVV